MCVSYDTLYTVTAPLDIGVLFCYYTYIDTNTMEFAMLLSLHFGRFFWLDDENEFCSCPAFEDGTADENNWDYVSEWQELEGVNLDKLFEIHRQLVTDKVTEYEQMRA